MSSAHSGLRAAVHRQLDPRAWPGRGLSPVNRILVALILLASIFAVVETEPAIYERHGGWLETAELAFGLAFLVEYAARLWSVAEDRGSLTAAERRLRFVLSPAALIDLAVIVLTLMPTVGLNPALLRLVRLARIARLARLGRFSTAFQRIALAFHLRRFELAATAMLAGGVLLLGATALYWIEGDVQPDAFGSVPRALWWAVVTLTTIGYGDVYPITAAGKTAGGLIGLAGIGLIALPAGIMAGAMQEAMRPEPPAAKSEATRGDGLD